MIPKPSKLPQYESTRDKMNQNVTKVHETMITEDDARTTTELADRFVIFPAMYQHGRAAIEAGSRLPEGFVYASNTNTDWLTHDQLTTILEGIAMGPQPIAER